MMNNAQIGISVVIPCYNAEGPLERCLESLRNCRYENLQIVLVNDSSTDDTENVIKGYIKNHPELTIEYFRNAENRGAGESRNCGICLATKEYITFVDADDTVLPDLLNEINKAAHLSNSDCIVFNATTKKSSGDSNFDMFYGGHVVGEQSLSPKYALVYTKGCTCGKAYKTSIIKDNNVQFGNIKRNEDLIFTKVALSYCRSVYYLNKTLYYYIENKNSLMHDTRLLDKENAHKAFDIISNRLNGRGFDEELHSMYLIEVIYSTTMTCLRRKEDAKQNYREATKDYKFNDRYYRAYNRKYRLIMAMFKFNMYWLLAKLV